MFAHCLLILGEYHSCRGCKSGADLLIYRALPRPPALAKWAGGILYQGVTNTMKGPMLIAAGIAITVICWGMYGPVLHKGQAGLSNDRFKPLICVGAAYLIIAIIVPVCILASRGQLSGGWTFTGISWSMLAGSAGAMGALGIILALSSGGSPTYVMPLVFGGAPVVNVFLAMYMSGAWKQGVNPVFYAGLILVIAGAITVLIFSPKSQKPHAEKPVAAAATDAGVADVKSDS